MPDFTDGWALTPGTPPTFDPTAAPDVFNPFGAGGPLPTVTTTTAQLIIDSARLRHRAFSDVQMPDGAALLFLNQRQRELLAMAATSIEGIVGTGMQYPLLTPGTGVLVSFANGVPYVGVAGQDGWVMHVDANDQPYVDITEPPIAADPIGDTPGFPLPPEMIRLVRVMALYRDGRWVEVDVATQQQRNTALPGRNLQAYIAGNRLMPMRRADTAALNAADAWVGVTGIQFSYVAMETLTALGDTIRLPMVLVGALIADTAAMLAMAAQSEAITPAERGMFQSLAGQARQEMLNAGAQLLGAVRVNRVNYRG